MPASRAGRRPCLARRGWGQSGAGMTLADTGKTLWQAFAAQHFCAADAMTNVRFCAMTLNAGSIYTNDSDVVKHRCLLNEIYVHVKLGM